MKIEKPEIIARQRIAFNGSEKSESAFFSAIEVKLEEYRERMRNLAEKGGNFEINDIYLDAKYKLHIGNAIRFKGGADHSSLLESLSKQDGPVQIDLFDNAWAVMRHYTENGDLQLGKDQISEGNDKKVAKLQISSSLGRLIWREVSVDGTVGEWAKTDIPVITDSGESTNDDGYEKLLAYLLVKYGKSKKIESF